MKTIVIRVTTVARAIALTQAFDLRVVGWSPARLRQVEQFFTRNPNAALDAFGDNSHAQRRGEFLRPEGELLERLGQRLAESAEVLDMLLAHQERFRRHGDQRKGG